MGLQGQAPHGSGICAARVGGEVAGGATAELGTARWGWRARREWDGHSRHGRQRARPAIVGGLQGYRVIGLQGLGFRGVRV